MRNHNPTPWWFQSSLQAVLWAVFALCVGNAFGSLTLDPLDLPRADSADTAKIRQVAEVQSAQILALEEIGDSAEGCLGRELLTKDPMDQFWNPYSYVGGDPLTGTDPWGLEEEWNPSVEGKSVDLGSSTISVPVPAPPAASDLTGLIIKSDHYDSKAAVAAFMKQLKTLDKNSVPQIKMSEPNVVKGGRIIVVEPPVFRSFSIGVGLPFCKAIGGSISVIRDVNGNYYIGGPFTGIGKPFSFSPSPVDLSFVEGYFKHVPRSGADLRNRIEGAGVNAQFGLGFGAGKLWSSTGDEAYYYGVMTPNAGVSAGWTYRRIEMLGGVE